MCGFNDFLKNFIAFSLNRDLAFRGPSELYFAGKRDGILIFRLGIFIENDKFFAEETVVGDPNASNTPNSSILREVSPNMLFNSFPFLIFTIFCHALKLSLIHISGYRSCAG